MKFLILGAGPAGLTFGNYLLQHGENSFPVLEKETVAGGLGRSEMVDGSSPLNTITKPAIIKNCFHGCRRMVFMD